MASRWNKVILALQVACHLSVGASSVTTPGPTEADASRWQNHKDQWPGRSSPTKCVDDPNDPNSRCYVDSEPVERTFLFPEELGYRLVAPGEDDHGLDGTPEGQQAAHDRYRRLTQNTSPVPTSFNVSVWDHMREEYEDWKAAGRPRILQKGEASGQGQDTSPAQPTSQSKDEAGVVTANITSSLSQSSTAQSSARKLWGFQWKPFQYMVFDGEVRNFFHTCAFRAYKKQNWWGTWWFGPWWDRAVWRGSARDNIVPVDVDVGGVATWRYRMSLLGSNTFWGGFNGDRWMPAICHPGYEWFSVGGPDWCQGFTGMELPPECSCTVCARWWEGPYQYPTDDAWMALPDTGFGMHYITRVGDWLGSAPFWALNFIRWGWFNNWGFQGTRLGYLFPQSPDSYWAAGLELWQPKGGAWWWNNDGWLILARCAWDKQRYIVNPWEPSWRQISVCGPKRWNMPRYYLIDANLYKVTYWNWVPVEFRWCRGWWFWRSCYYWELLIGTARSGVCTDCGWDNYKIRDCTAVSNAVCRWCGDVCPWGSHVDRPCDGRGYRPGCVNCLADIYRGDGWGNRWNWWDYWTQWWDGVTRSSVTCDAGTYNIRSGQQTEVMYCTRLQGWDVRGQVCRPCDPPKLPLAYTPYPYPFHDSVRFGQPKDSFNYWCAPGFHSVGRNIGPAHGVWTCPVANNRWGNQWFWKYNQPLQCVCDGIGASHVCATNGLHEGWVRQWAGPEFLRFTYSALPGVWPSNPALPEWRGELLGAVRFVFEVDHPDGRLVYEFNPLMYPDVRTSWTKGEVIFTNTVQYNSAANVKRGRPYFHARAILRASAPPSSAEDKRIPLKMKTKEDDIDLELWYGAESALKQKMGNAHGYFAVPLYAEQFSLDVRVTLIDSWTGLMDAHLARERAQGPLPWQNGLYAFFTNRAVASVKFAWLSRRCPKGQYQVGDTCETCPLGYYSTLPYRSRNYKSDRSGLKPVTGADVDQPICQQCSCCLSCQQCKPDGPACFTYPTFCSWAGTCIPAWYEPPATKCQWCSPAQAQDRYSPQPKDRPCTDDDTCTFYDGCDGKGFCYGVQDDCLRSAVDPSKNCEVCGQDKCDTKPGYSGCVYYYPETLFSKKSNASALVPAGSLYGKRKSCGCSIDGVCYPHQTLNPNNTCQWCDVTINAAAWSPTPPKPCNDGKMCTHSDVCSSGTCTGVPITCEVTPETPCLKSSTCTGTDKCKLVYQASSYMCADSVGYCQPRTYCTGKTAACPPPTIVLPIIMPGALTVAAPLDGPELDTAARLGRQVLPDLPGSPEIGLPVTDVSRMLFVADDWSVLCGGLTYRVGLYQDQDRSTGCNVDAVFQWGRRPWLWGLGKVQPYP